MPGAYRSAHSASGVEPMISANMIVTTRLSSGGGNSSNGCVLPLLLASAVADVPDSGVAGDGDAGDGRGLSLFAASGVPHSMQNFAMGRLIVPQFGQITRRFPHSRQNLVPTGLFV